eukprot:524294-Rhodomonas_salina.2
MNECTVVRDQRQWVMVLTSPPLLLTSRIISSAPDAAAAGWKLMRAEKHRRSFLRPLDVCNQASKKAAPNSRHSLILVEHGADDCNSASNCHHSAHDGTPHANPVRCRRTEMSCRAGAINVVLSLARIKLSVR